MLKKSLLFMMLLAVFGVAGAQTIVEIGDGTTAGYYTPIGTYYNYSITEQLYTADEIGTEGTIMSISFYYALSTAKAFPITVYMANVDAENLSEGISLADADEVFSGTLSVTEAGWATIELDSPFAYDGRSNLLIGINKSQYQWFSGSTWRYTAATDMARYTQSDGTAYDTSTVPGTKSNNRPNIQIAIQAGGGPVCEKPATLEASLIATTSATLAWTGGSGTYNLEYKKASDEDWTTKLTNSTATTCNLTGLVPGTTYQARVQSVCDGDVSGWKSVSFSTMFGIPLNETFGTAIPTGWAQYSGLLSTIMEGGDFANGSAWLFGNNSGIFDEHARINIYGTGVKNWLVLPAITMENNVQLMFDVALAKWSSSGTTPTAPDQNGTDDRFIVLVNDGREWQILREWNNSGSEYVYNDLTTTPITVAINLSSFAGDDIQVAFYGESTASNADNNLHIDNVSIDYIPSCPKPTGLTVNSVSGNTATLTWEGSASSYELLVGENVYTVNGTSKTVTDLEYATEYEAMVRANCGSDGYSDWTNTVSFRTDNCDPADQCALTFVVTDKYGDGWNGASIDIYDYTGEEVGDLLASITNQNLDGNSGCSGGACAETQTYIVNFCNGQRLAIIWSSGSYDGECEYVVTDVNGDVVVEGDGEGFDGFAYEIDCTITDCRKPSNFEATEIGPHSVVLSWTENGPATSWVLAYISEDDEDVTEITVNTNPYTLTGLTPETMYAAQVTPVCEVEKPSEVIYWTTEVACPAPRIAVTPYAFSADVEWTNYADNYTLEYAELPVSKSPYSGDGWYYYDNGTYAGAVGLGGGQFYWGVMFPAGTYVGTSVDAVKAYDINAMVGELIIYNDGDTAPANEISRQDIEFTGAADWVEFTTAASIDPSKNVWIVFNAADGAAYPMGTSNDDNGDVNGRWVEISGSWYDMGDVGVTGRANMIRAHFSSINYDDLRWETVEGIQSPYTITGLTEETLYIVRVKAVCGGEDGESVWTTATFTTTSACDMPINLAAIDITHNSAKLSWTGYQTSYNVKYRQVPHGDILESQNFDDSSMGEWTTIDADGDGYTWVLGSEAGGIYLVEGGSLAGQGHNDSEDLVVSGSYSNVEGVGALTPDNYLVSPEVAFGGVISFWACAQDASYPSEHFGVAVSTESNTDPDDFTTIAEWTLTAQGTGAKTMGTWGKFTVDLSEYTGRGYVAIRHFDCTDMFMLDIDDITIESALPEIAWTTTTTTEPELLLTDLTPNTDYEWQIQGVNASCGDLEWSEVQTFFTEGLPIQSIEILEGWNQCSFDVEITLNQLKAALLEAMPGTTIMIKGQNNQTSYDPARNRWIGNMTWNIASMYKIKAEASGVLEVQGWPIEVTEHPITIKNGHNWIAFPLSESMTLTDAFAGFASNGDMVKSQDGTATYARNRWQGQLTTLEPGKGYDYKSNVSSTRTFVFPSGSSKAAPKSVTTENANGAQKATNCQNLVLPTNAPKSEVIPVTERLQMKLQKK